MGFSASPPARCRLGAALALLVLAGCASVERPAIEPLPGISVIQRPSPNFDERRPNYVVLHHTSNASAEASLRTLTDPARRVSSHYLVARNGNMYALVDNNARAWHAGESYWAGLTDLNSASIGIELDNDGSEPYSEVQIAALLDLLAALKTRFAIPRANFIGHGDIAPGRKVDPSAHFPWRLLASQGFGIWCDPPYDAVPPSIDDALLLQALGYNVWNFDAAVSAFKRHFSPEDPSPAMTGKDRSLAYCLIMEKRALAAQGS